MSHGIAYIETKLRSIVHEALVDWMPNAFTESCGLACRRMSPAKLSQKPGQTIGFSVILACCAALCY